MDHSEFHHSNVKLGKQGHVKDERTLMLAKYFGAVTLPANYDFDANRKPIPDHMWGNDQYGDCVIAGEANEIMRLERVETWSTPRLTDDDAIKRYSKLTGCKSPGDANDTGLVILYTNRDWRNNGFQIAYNNRNYKIAAYGELDFNNPEELRTAIYLLHGVQFGLALPIAAQKMTNQGKWDYNGQTGSEWEPGSWGGHCVYGKKYSPNSIFVKTWGMEIEMTNAFIKKYADEAWGVVDNLDTWRATHHFDVAALEADLKSISGKVNQ